MENPQVLKDLLKQNVPIVAPFLKTYETFGHVRRICDIGLEHPLNDSSAFPDIIAQKGLREQNYEIIKVSILYPDGGQVSLPAPSVWSKTTLNTGGVGGAGAGPPTYKIRRFFLIPLELTIRIINNF